MDRELPLSAPLDHPCYAGHFPGAPIVPGVVLLDLVVEALGRGAPRRVDSVKFHRALQPGEAFTLRWEQAGPKATFRCLAADAALIVEGNLTFA